MMKVKIYNLQNEAVGETELPKDLFGVKWNPTLVHQVLTAQTANRRQPWAHAKDRSEVRGGGRKPWRQKGTGRARHGSRRSPLWSGGGKAHGPNKERDYSQKVNKKMRRLAILSVLSRKLHDNEIKIFNTLELQEPKTKMLYQVLLPILEKDKRTKKLDVIMIPAAENKALFRAGRNLVKTKVTSPDSLNVYDLLNHKNVFIDQNAIGLISRRYSSSKTV